MQRSILSMGLLLSLISLLLVTAADGSPIENCATTKDTRITDSVYKGIVYWGRVIPNTTIPSAILDLVNTQPIDEGNNKKLQSLEEDDNKLFFYKYGASKEGNTKKLQSKEEDDAKVTFYKYGGSKKDSNKKLQSLEDDDNKLFFYKYGASKEGNSKKLQSKEEDDAKVTFYRYGGSKKGSNKKLQSLEEDDNKFLFSKYGANKEGNNKKLQSKEENDAKVTFYKYKGSRKGSNKNLQSLEEDDNKPLFYKYGASKESNNKKLRSKEDDDAKVTFYKYVAHKMDNDKKLHPTGVDDEKKRETQTKGDATEYICDQPDSTTTNGQGGRLEGVHSNGEPHLATNSRGVFFFEDQLVAGSKMTTLVPWTAPRRPAPLDRETADSIPFSSKNLAEIAAMFTPAASPAMARNIKVTLDACEDTSRVKGETRGCATSVESMVDLATSTLGTRDVRAFSPDVPTGGLPSRRYSLAAVRRAFDSARIMVCHDMPYPYMVYFCHMIVPSRAYLVTLASDGGGSPPTEALAMCHLDTSSWDPNHAFFRMTGVKPGETTACHFVNRGSVVWTPVGDQGEEQVAAE